MSKRASGRARHAVRAEAMVLVSQLGPQPFPSIRAAARAIAELVPYAFETVRRALNDDTLTDELELLVDHGNHEGTTEGTTREPQGNHIAKPQLDDPPVATPPPPTPYVSTSHSQTGHDPGPAQLPQPPRGRRPKEYRRSSFPGRCVICEEELELGHAFYLTPYDTGTVTACLEHAALALAGAQMFYDVARGRAVPEELELVIRPRPTR